MPRYCLDTNTFIESKNGPYDMQVHPAFWSWLDSKFQDGSIFSCAMVYGELTAADDDLAAWAKARRAYFREPSRDVQIVFSEIADFVNIGYPRHQAEPFLAGADPWVIAVAKCGGAVVVTHEVLVPSDSKRVKIPNICQRFGVSWINLYEMLRRLSARFM